MTGSLKKVFAKARQAMLAHRDEQSSSGTQAHQQFAVPLRESIAALLIGAILFTILLVSSPDLFESYDNTLRDTSIFSSFYAPKTEDTVLIVCSDNGLDDMGGWPLDRALHAQLLNGPLADAKVVAFDMLFIDETENDEIFAQAMRNHGNVILARSDSNLPCATLFESAARVGYSSYDDTSSDNTLRNYKLFHGQEAGPTLVGAMLLANGYEIEQEDGAYSWRISRGDEEILLRGNDTCGLPRIPVQNSSLEIYEYSQVLCGYIDPSVFADKMVILGTSISGYHDTVYAAGYSLAGEHLVSTEIIGAQYILESYASVLSGFSPVKADTWLLIAVSLVLYAFAAFLTMRIPLRFSLAAILAEILAWAFAAHLLYVFGLCIISTLVPHLAIGIAYFIMLVVALVRVILNRQHISRATAQRC